jgi:ATP-binding cassette, subfamily B, bacterial PglK
LGTKYWDRPGIIDESGNRLNILIKLRSRWRETTIYRSTRVLSRTDQKKIFAVVILQVTFGLLDLIGVALLGILGALAVSGIESRKAGNRVNSALDLLGLAGKSFQSQVAIIGLLSAGLLIGRTIFSIIFTRRILFFLSTRAAHISKYLISKVLSQSMLKLNRLTTQELVYAVTVGVNSITVGVIGVVVNLISDGSLLLVMAVGLFFVDPWIALATFLVFSSLGYLLFKFLHKRAQKLGTLNAELSIKTNEKITEVLGSYRESVVRNRRGYYAESIGEIRLAVSNVLAELAFMPNVGKYVIESSMVLGALVISAIQFTLQDAAHAVATLVVFMAAATRIAPAILRVQQGAIAIKGSLGAARPTLDLLEEFENTGELVESEKYPEFNHPGFIGKISIRGVSLKYPDSAVPALKDINLEIEHGSVVALVGPSGAGKTSLVDIILGIIEEFDGKIEVSGNTPGESILKWPGAIAYVPQDVIIIDGTIRENVALGFPADGIESERILEPLKLAALGDFINSLKNGIDTSVGERGSRISGGQRQRLGVARALFTEPKLLVLDEATSALDGEAEFEISKTIEGMRGESTVILIAHRLSTVKRADLVVYLEEGYIRAKGTFEEVRAAVPNFDKQAKLMGI